DAGGNIVAGAQQQGQIVELFAGGSLHLDKRLVQLANFIFALLQFGGGPAAPSGHRFAGGHNFVDRLGDVAAQQGDVGVEEGGAQDQHQQQRPADAQCL